MELTLAGIDPDSFDVEASHHEPAELRLPSDPIEAQP
jgi:hypothetical protein